MTHGSHRDHRFDRDYWERHWHETRPDPADPAHLADPAHPADPADTDPPHPYLPAQLDGLAPGTALDAGCGTGAGAAWLAARGWDATGVDISASALARAAARAARLEPATAAGLGPLRWVEADLTAWEPDAPVDLVVTCYAHPAMPVLAFYERLAGWVRPGGRLLVVAHRRVDTTADHSPPADATVGLADIVGVLPGPEWDVVTAEEHERTPPGHGTPLHDVVVHAARRRAVGPT